VHIAGEYPRCRGGCETLKAVDLLEAGTHFGELCELSSMDGSKCSCLICGDGVGMCSQRRSFEVNSREFLLSSKIHSRATQWSCDRQKRT
jgi:hypothetical protein